MAASLPDETVTFGDDSLEIRKDIPSPRRTVWKCLTDPICLKTWWRNNIEFEPRKGGRFVEPWVDPSGRDRVTKAQVTSFHPSEGLVMVWADDDWTFDTVVSVSLSDIECGTRVTIEHQGWERAPEADRSGFLEHHHAGWTRHLGNLAQYAHDFGDDPTGSGRGH